MRPPASPGSMTRDMKFCASSAVNEVAAIMRWSAFKRSARGTSLRRTVVVPHGTGCASLRESVLTLFKETRVA